MLITRCRLAAAILFCLLCLGASPQIASAQTYRDVSQSSDGELISLPHGLTADEMLILDEIGKGHRTTPPPTQQPVRHVAEFEPMQGVLIRWPLGIPTALVAEMSEDTIVYCIVTSGSQSSAYNSFNNAGANMANVVFYNHNSDTYWTRDYGPWYIFDDDEECSIVDVIYNRPRPNDDAVPSDFADYLGIDAYGPNLITAGGNWMADGRGIAASSDLIWEENPGQSHAQIDQTVEDYLGIHTYHVVPDPNGTYIDHIDCWGKFLSVDTILLREVPTSHSQYDEIEATVDYFESQLCSYGTPYNVVRVYTPNNQPYTNSLILNKKVLVPITGSGWDDDALAAYEAAMPGYEVLGFTGSWQSTDALHCRAKGVADLGMLYVYSTPMADADEYGPYLVTAEIIDHSQTGLIGAELELFWRPDGSGPFNAEPLAAMGSDVYGGYIPAQPAETTIQYYFSAADNSGRTESYPYTGRFDPFEFEVLIDPSDVADIDPRLILSCQSANPIAGSGVVRYSLDRDSEFSLRVFDAEGRMVRTLVNDYHGAGDYHITWNGESDRGEQVNPGVYFYRLSADGEQRVERVILVK
jgi:agmatine deiminase